MNILNLLCCKRFIVRTSARIVQYAHSISLSLFFLSPADTHTYLYAADWKIQALDSKLHIALIYGGSLSIFMQCK